MMRETGRRGGASGWGIVLGLFLLPVLVVGGWFAIARMDNPLVSAAPEAAVLVPVLAEDLTAQVSLPVALGDAAGREITAELTGRVTAVPVLGAVIGSGDVVLAVDDREVWAMVSGAPLWRSLVIKDSGEDVRRLQEFLGSLGYAAGTVDGTFGRTLEKAVVAFNLDAGLGKDQRVFDPATVVWVGPEPVTVVQVLVTAGQVLEPGTVVFAGPERPGSVLVTEPPGGIVGVGDFSGGAELTVGETVVAYEPGSGAVSDPEAVEALRAGLAPATEGTARARSTAAKAVTSVPASALVTGMDGTVCVYASAEAAPTTVVPVGGGVNTVQLAADFPLAQVLANPGRVPLAVPCAS